MNKIKFLKIHGIHISLILQLIATLGCYLCYIAIYNWRNTTIAKLEFAIDYTCLFIGGIIAGSLSIISLYQHLKETDNWLWLTIETILAIISLFIASVFTYALLIFLAII